MAAHCFPKTFIVGLAFTTALLLPTLCMAQDSLDSEAAGRKLDNPGCTDLTVLSKLPESAIVSCDKGDSMEVTMPLKPDAQGYAREKSVRGVYEFREFQILQADQQEHVFDNLMQLLGIAGFTVKYSSSPSMITARKQDTWMLIRVSGEYYDVSVVHSKEDPWTPVKDAQEISREMEAHRRVAIYGIEFAPDNQAVIEENSKILSQVLKYLKGNPGLAVDVESHKMSVNGTPQNDLEITRKRAKAVVDWLEAHGIAAERLQPKGLGRIKPVTENDTPLEIQRNERFELAQTAP